MKKIINFWKDKKIYVILLLISLLIIKIPQEEPKFVFWILAGICLCSIFDVLINKIFLKKEIFPTSAMISGLIVSGIIDYRQSWLILIIFSILPIISKHLIKFNKRHIFNPAVFALFVATLFKISLTWTIESNIFLIILFGIYFVYRYKKIFHVLGFLIFFTGLFAIYKVNSLGFISWFFLLIMLIEPKTSGYGILRGFIFGSLIGVFAFLIFNYMPTYDAFIASLFAVNLANPVFDKIFDSES